MLDQPLDALAALLNSLTPVNSEASASAAEHHLTLAKPPGSLGGLETIGCRLAAIAGETIPPEPSPAAIAVFAGDHGVLAEGVSPWPQEISSVMAANFRAGGAAVNAIAASNGIDLVVVNAGLAHPIPPIPAGPNGPSTLIDTPVRSGTANLRTEPAMGRDEAAAAIMLGVSTGRDLIADGARCLLTGDMGIGNTTPSAAVIAALTGVSPADVGSITGRGTGIDDATLERKTTVIADALTRAAASGADMTDAFAVTSEVGGLEIAAIAGLCLAGAEAKIPVIVDGVIALAGATIASALSSAAVGYLIAGHRSVEPAATAALTHLGLDPIIDLQLRLGEGTGAALAYPIVKAAAAVMAQMATLESLS